MLKPEEVGCKDAKEQVDWLNKFNPITKITYPEPVYMTKVFQEGDSFLPQPLPEYPKGLCPKCEELNEILVGLPCFPAITKEQCDFIIERFKAVAAGED